MTVLLRMVGTRMDWFAKVWKGSSMEDSLVWISWQFFMNFSCIFKISATLVHRNYSVTFFQSFFLNKRNVCGETLFDTSSNASLIYGLSKNIVKIGIMESAEKAK